MKRKILKFIVLTLSVLVLTLIFAVPTSAETTVIDVGDLDIVSIDVPSGAQVTTWSCTPYGYVTFEDPSNSGNTYSTWITAELPGTVTIKATVKYADDSTSTVTVKTYLNVLKNGIYTIGNDYADNYYSSSGEFFLRSQITYPTSSGLYVAQHSQNNFGDESNKIYNYWRVTYLGSEQYTIQSVADESKYLSYSGSTLSLANVRNSITTTQKWYIRGENIIPVSNTSKCLILASNSPSGTYHTDGNVYYYFNLNVNTVAGMEFENWSFTKVKKKGVLFVDDSSGELKTTFTKTYNIDKETIEFSELGYSLKIYHYENYPSPTIRWSSSKSSVATINSNTGKLTLNGAGRAIITVTAEFAGQTEASSASYTLDVVLIDDGTYFIKNIDTVLYADIQNNSITSGNEIEQQKFDGSNFQEWIFTHIGNNIYTIKTAGSSTSTYYLGVENNSTVAGADIVLRTGTVSNSMKWKIEYGNNGYKIVSCLNSAGNLVLSANSGNAVEGEKLVIYEYTDDTDYMDEWDLYLLGKHNINVDIVYDYAYKNRYGEANARIRDEILVLQEKYLREFEITINDISLSTFYSYADTACTTSHTIECSHATNTSCIDSELFSDGTIRLETYHHTNIYNIMLRIPLPNLSTSVKVAYIGHELCTENNHESHPYYGLTARSLGLSTVTNFSSKTSETKTLIHEFGHFYSVIDHYGGSAKTTAKTTAQIIAATGNTGYNINCIYGENKDTEEVLSNFTICEGCKSIIESNIGRYDYQIGG